MYSANIRSTVDFESRGSLLLLSCFPELSLLSAEYALELPANITTDRLSPVEFEFKYGVDDGIRRQ